MELFIFSEFCRLDIIDSFKKAYPNIKVVQSEPLKSDRISKDLSHKR